MGLLETFKIYIAPSGADSASKSRDLVRLAALGITAGYAVALTYRAGGFKYILPPPIYNSLVSGVEKIKEGTQPIVHKERFALCSQHLQKTYGLLSAGCVLSAVGTRTFFAFPDMPIGVPIAVSVTAASTLLFARKHMTLAGRLVAFGTMCLATGVSFGPLNWVAFDSVLPFAVVVSSTAVGFCAPLYITRGFVSYFCSSQLLSCSLSIVGCGMIVASAKADRGISPKARARLQKDVSTMVTLQVLANLGVYGLHTFPAIYRFIHESVGELEQEDFVAQAGLIYGSFAYTLWTFFRIVCSRIFRSLSGKKKVKVSEDLKETLGGIAHDTSKSSTLFTISNMSNLSASLMFLFTYVRLVTYLQNNAHGSSKAFDLSRKAFAFFSPV